MLLSEQQIKDQQAEQLAEVISYVGSVGALAAQLSVSYARVMMWIQRGRISATCATKVERMSAGRFKRKDLRPDVSNWREDV